MTENFSMLIRTVIVSLADLLKTAKHLNGAVLLILVDLAFIILFISLVLRRHQINSHVEEIEAEINYANYLRITWSWMTFLLFGLPFVI